MNSNWFKLIMKMTKAEYGKNLLLKGVPIIFNKGGAKLKIGENVTIKSSFLSNLVGLYSRTIIVTRAPGAEIEIPTAVDCTDLFFEFLNVFFLLRFIFFIGFLPLLLGGILVGHCLKSTVQVNITQLIGRFPVVCQRHKSFNI